MLSIKIKAYIFFPYLKSIRFWFEISILNKIRWCDYLYVQEYGSKYFART